ncbi:GNAT family N-acetyltransferase [Catenibacterium mitsuokai]|uniref:GNAT family N-acetyltransferase n=1 Tax=Catenibacterium mitsuokai TaxID=100886 RepID=UPI0022043071|nr:GNAT family N-acetyltransferase [Catenibacterium mitsuokai]UWO54480.1 GNAT family N-acetyltransferase [Catenibacterium mitsuokai]
MDFRQAVMQDLPQLKDMYKRIIKNMNEQNIQIWDDIYPCEFFEDDIKNNKLYILLNNGEIVSAFVLSDTNSGETAVEWNDNHAKAVYIDRLGVNIKYLKKGLGSLMLDKAKEIAKTLNAEYLRLFVVDINIPAIQLYTKKEFVKVNGVYNEIFDDGFVLHEHGYEIKL